MTDDLKTTPLHGLHERLGAKMTPFAGYEMPLQYAPGVLKEHVHTREKAGLFDVSHMGQIVLRPHSGNVADAARALETLVPQDILGLRTGRQRYALFTNEQGGIEDDLMVANRGDHLFVVVNAACKADDIERLRSLSESCEIEPLTDRALLALQGPNSEDALASLDPECRDLRFMDVCELGICGAECIVSRSGYTGEDGFEISIPEAKAVEVAEALLAHEAVEPVGLGARDSLRVEAGLCLYGQDMDSGLNPVEASLSWAIQKVRRRGGERAGGFPGSDAILDALENGVDRHRVGLRPEGRAPMRQGVPLFESESGGEQIGFVTSGVYGPSVEGPVAMGLVADSMHEPGTRLYGELRGKRLPVDVVPLPFIETGYKR